MFSHDFAYILQQPDTRICFAIPYEDKYTLIGTTDADHEGSLDKVEADASEIRYLCDAVNRYFEHDITPDDVVWSYAGVRALVDFGKDRPEAATRGYRLVMSDADEGAPLLGIYGGKIVLDGTLDLVGLNIEPLSVGGEFSGAYTSQRPFTDSQLAAMQAQLRDGYDTFTGHVAAGRNLTSAQVEQIARGRVWTGAQAVEIGLVDELGGFRTALAAAKREAGIDADENVTLRSYPARPTFFEQVQRLFGNSGEMAETASVLMQIAAMPEVRAMIAARSASGQPASARADIPAVR